MVSGDIVALPTDGSDPTHHGWVAENNDNDNYNFYGDQNTSLDEVEDRYDLGQVAGEDDLVAIRIDPVSGAVDGDMTMLSFPMANIRIWRTADKGGGSPIISGIATFDATEPQTLYVEGLNLSSTVDAEKIDLKFQSINAAGLPVTLDTLFLTVYEVTGALNVPSYSQHTYQAKGPAGANFQWAAGTGSTITSTNGNAAGGFVTSVATILWGEGGYQGTFKVKPSDTDGFTPHEVNVVMVRFVNDGDSQLTLDGSMQIQRPSKYGVGTTPDGTKPPFAMYGRIKVAEIKGAPVRDPDHPGQWINVGGQKFIDFGSIQTVTIDNLHGDFGTPATIRVTNPYEGQSFIDLHPNNAPKQPWYRAEKPTEDVDGKRGYYSLTDDPATSVLVDMVDSPSFDCVPYFSPPGSTQTVSFYSEVLKFTSYFAVHTKDPTNDANKSYTIRASAQWDWNGSGTVGPGPVLTGYIYTPSFGVNQRITSPTGPNYNLRYDGSIISTDFTKPNADIAAVKLLSVKTNDWIVRNL